MRNQTLVRVVPRRRPAGGVWAAVLAGCGLLAVGCSSAAHDREHAERLRAHAHAAEFAPLKSDATSVAGGRLGLRLPKDFVDQVDDRQAATPAFLREFPGFAAGYRFRRPVGNAQFPVELIVGMVPTAERRREDVRQSILEQARGDESFRKAAWGKPRQVEDLAGQPRTWDVLVLDGEQPFELIDAGSPVEKRRPGVSEIWVSAEPKQKACVVLAWRVPAELATGVPLSVLAPLTARTVVIPE